MGKWLPGENDLVSEQKEFLNSIRTSSDNIYLSGFPGSGKSVCLLYAVHAIRKQNPNASILIVEYTHALIKMLKAALDELHIRNVAVVTYFQFRKRDMHYDYIICDEVQDIPGYILELMQQRATRVITGGDRNQSIYEGGASQDELESILRPRKKELTILHRLNKFLVSAINSYMPNMTMLTDRVSMMKKHKKVNVVKYASIQDEVRHIMSEAEDAVNYGHSTAILFHTHKELDRFVKTHLANAGKRQYEQKLNQYEKPDYDHMNCHLVTEGVKLHAVINGYGTFMGDANKITLLTYSSAKGLDFDRVYMPFCTPTISNCWDTSLFMVAMSRSRDELYLSFTNSPNEHIQSFINTTACHFDDQTAAKPVVAAADDDDLGW